MSTVYLSRFKTNNNNDIIDSEDICECQNAHGFKPRIWSAIAELYDNDNMFTPWEVSPKFWRLAESDKLPLLHRLAFGLSFDFGYFKAIDIPVVVSALNSLNDSIKMIKDSDKKVNHIQAVIDDLRKDDLKSDFCYYFYDSINEDFFVDECFDEDDEPIANNMNNLLGQNYKAWDIVETWKKDNVKDLKC